MTALNEDLRVMYYSPHDLVNGLTFGQWTVKWWEWFVSSQPTDSSLDSLVFLSDGGQNAGNKVWFLSGKVGDSNKTIPNRFSKIPKSHSILFPVINCEVNKLEFPELKEDIDLVNHVRTDENMINITECSVDGKSIPAQRIRSNPEIFDLYFGEINPYGVKRGWTRAAADGYWVFLKPLSGGSHSLTFHASCKNGSLNSGANYQLEII